MSETTGAVNVWAAHVAAVGSAAAAGGLAAKPDNDWYRKLDMPRWQPPPAVFGPVWSGLYALTAYAGTTVWRQSDSRRDRSAFAVAYAANLALNAGWTWTFFRARRLPLAAVHAAVLELSTIDLIRRANRCSPRAAAALAPYAAWNAFAIALSGDLARRNHERQVSRPGSGAGE